MGPHRAEGAEEGPTAFFAAGASLALLDAILRQKPTCLGALRNRLALKAAATSARILRLREDEAALRDAEHLAAAEDPGPPGAYIVYGALSPAKTNDSTPNALGRRCVCLICRSWPILARSLARCGSWPRAPAIRLRWPPRRRRAPIASRRDRKAKFSQHGRPISCWPCASAGKGRCLCS